LVVESAGQSLNVDERNAGEAQLHRLTEHLQQDWRERAVYLKALAFAAIGAVNAAIDFSLFSFAHYSMLGWSILTVNMLSWGGHCRDEFLRD
jgi:hypothetical protein